MDIEAVVEKHLDQCEKLNNWYTRENAGVAIRNALTELAAEYEAVAQVTKMNSDRLLRKANERIHQLEAEQVPEGWQLVPTVPTQEMADAYWLAYDECSEGSHLGTCYAALLDAAQQQKKEGGVMKLIIGNKYNWIGRPERLVYIGKDGKWHQFAKVETPAALWCEALYSDIHMLEETKESDNGQ